MGAHLIDGEFQSDKYPTTPRGKVPLSVRDVTAQDLLYAYAQRRRLVDVEFSDDLETALERAGYRAGPSVAGVVVVETVLETYVIPRSEVRFVTIERWRMSDTWTLTYGLVGGSPRVIKFSRKAPMPPEQNAAADEGPHARATRLANRRARRQVVADPRCSRGPDRAVTRGRPVRGSTT